MIVGDPRVNRELIEPGSTALLHVIVNPAAGGGRAGRRWPSFEAELARNGYEIKPTFTAGPGDATRMARQLAHDGARTVVCVGGDGTANEIVNGLIEDDRPISNELRLAIVPCGTGKDFGRTLGTRNITSMLRALADDSTTLIDVGKASYWGDSTAATTTRYFANVADAGIGAQTAARINASSKAFGGFVSYLTGALRSIASFSAWDIDVDVDGVAIHRGLAGMVVIANARYFAGGMKVAPRASVCDGLLDVFVLQDVGKRTLLTSLLPRVYRGQHVGQPGVVHLTGRTASVRCAAGMLVELDGEQLGRTPLTVNVVPRVLRVVGTREALADACGCTECAE